MGSGVYSLDNRTSNATTRGYHTKPVNEIFESRDLDLKMNPHGVTWRESRDNDEHPNSLAIILALDVTGSMYRIPHSLVKDGLPTMMGNIIERGIEDPQLLFLAVGDHYTDRAPLQVSQFESSDELLDQWLTTVFLEGNGGGNFGESYFLTWYFAAQHTVTDDWEKRGNKGFLFTIGDEPTHQTITANQIQSIMGPGEHKNWSAEELYAAASEKFHVFHLHVKEGSNGTNPAVIESWKNLLGENLIEVNDFNEIPKLIANKIVDIRTANKNIVEEEQKTDDKIVL